MGLSISFEQALQVISLDNNITNTLDTEYRRLHC